MMLTPITALRPAQHLRHLLAQYPHLPRHVEALRSRRGRDLPQWPAWCYLPLAGTVAILTGGTPQPDLRPLGMQIGRVGALMAWRATQGIYLFDPVVFGAVWETPLTGDLPTALLYHLPEWCCYVPVQPARVLIPALPPLHGFWVHLEWDTHTHHTELRFVLDLEDTLLPLALHVQAPGGLAGACERAFDAASEQLLRHGEVEQGTRLWAQSADSARQLVPHLAPLVSLTLYLCSEAAEIQDQAGRRPTRPQPQRTKRGERLFAASHPTTWQVAYRLGAALRHAQQVAKAQGQPSQPSEARLSPRAHIRRAHWHTYYTGVGSRRDPALRQARVHWLAPIPVGLPAALVPTIRPVS